MKSSSVLSRTVREKEAALRKVETYAGRIKAAREVSREWEETKDAIENTYRAGFIACLEMIAEGRVK